MTATTRRSTRLRPIHLVLSLLLALAGVVAIGAPARAAVDEINGTITVPVGVSDVGIPIYLSQDISVFPTGPLFPSLIPAAVTGIGGIYSISGVAPGAYLVLADGGDDLVQGFEIAGVDGITDPGATVNIALEKGVLITGTVRPAANALATLGGIAVAALADSGVGGLLGGGEYFDLLTFDADVFAPVTGPLGTYRIVVPLDETYEVSAFDTALNPLYAEQSWNHRNGCGCAFDPIVTPDDPGWPYSPYAPTSAIDFDLLAFADYLYFEVQATHGSGPTAYPNVQIFLELETAPAVWTVQDDAIADVDGFVDLFAITDGDYRLRFQIGGVDAAVLSAFEPGCPCSPYTLDDGGKKVLLGGYIKSSPGDGYFEGADVELLFATPSSGGGGGTPATPRPRTRTTNFGTFTLPTPTPTPSATPTSSPSPSSSPSSSPSPSETPDPTEPTSDAGFPWWIILIIVLILGIIITIIVIVRRR